MSILTNNVGVQRIKICKIYQSGSSFFAFAGMDQDDRIGFVSSEIAKRGMMLNLKSRAEQFTKDVRAPLLRSLALLYETSRQIYQQEIPGDVALTAIFVALEGGRASFYLIQINKVEDSVGKPIDLKIEIHSCPGDACPANTDKPFPIWLGNWQAARKEYERMLTFRDTRLSDDVTTLRHLIEMEIADEPEKVGPPIAVATIDALGAHWSPGGKCSSPQNKLSNKKQHKK
jgi:hypothetical protein